MKTKYAFLSVASLILVECGSTSEVTSNENQSECLIKDKSSSTNLNRCVAGLNLSSCTSYPIDIC